MASLLGKAQDSSFTKSHFASFYGSTGLIMTPNTRTVGKFNGNIGVFENFHSDSLDQVVFCFGVHPNIEVGIQSGIPTQPNARMSFFFKIKGFEQGRFFGLRPRLFPATAFGLQQNGAFAIAGYGFGPFDISGGLQFQRPGRRSLCQYQLPALQYAALQSEYQNGALGLGLRTQYRGVEFSILYRHHTSNDKPLAQNAWWRLAYNFRQEQP